MPRPHGGGVGGSMEAVKRAGETRRKLQMSGAEGSASQKQNYETINKTHTQNKAICVSGSDSHLLFLGLHSWSQTLITILSQASHFILLDRLHHFLKSLLGARKQEMGWFLHQSLEAMKQLIVGVVSYCILCRWPRSPVSQGLPGRIQFHTPQTITSVTEVHSQLKGNMTILTESMCMSTIVLMSA